MNIRVAQIGARRHYAVPAALAAEGKLEQLVTDAYADVWPWRALKTLPAPMQHGLLASILARRSAQIPADKVRGMPRFSLERHLIRRRRHSEDNLSFWLRCNRVFCQRVAAQGFGSATAVYCYNGAALEIFEAARRLGLYCILDQTSAPMRHDAKLLAREAGRWPDWCGLADRPGNWRPMAEREEAEWQLADRIICGSDYVASALARSGGPAARCRVVPYGVAPAAAASDSPRKPDGPLRLLFVGTLNLRKGIPYLHAALEQLGSCVQTRLVGPSATTDAALATLRKVADVVGPVPRSAMATHYAWADVLVLPTLSEGSANVCFEALAAGVPVVTTHEAGSVVTDQREGLLIPAASEQALIDAIRHMAEHSADYARMSAAALARARQFTPQRYAHELLRVMGQATEAELS